jgi:replicative DNA helicase
MDEEPNVEAPRSIEAERAVLGAIMLRHEKFAAVAAHLRPADFFHPTHKAIFEAMEQADSVRAPLDSSSVFETMRSLGIADKLSAAGGLGYLVELQGEVITTENAEHLAKLLADKAERRRIAETLESLALKALDPETSETSFFREFEERILALSGARSTTRGPKPIRDALKSFVRELGARYEASKTNGAKLVGMATGFAHLDRHTGGLRPGQQVVIAARPAMGKSALAINIAEGAALTGVPVFVLSAEMSDVELIERMVAANGGIDSSVLRNGRLTQLDWIHVQSASTRLADLPVVIDDDGDANINDLRRRVRRWRSTTGKAEHAMVIVDYLQLMRPTNDDGVRERQVAEISRGLKMMAKETGCAVIALSQLNRQLESRQDKRPMLMDLRESGAIEQDADIVMFLYRDEVYRPSTDKWKSPFEGFAELNISKHRAGSCGRIWLRWDAIHTKFEQHTGPEPVEVEE